MIRVPILLGFALTLLGCEQRPEEAAPPIAESGSLATPVAAGSALSCVSPQDTFGVATAVVDGPVDRDQGGDAYFGLAADSSHFFLTLSQQETGHFHIEFEIPGRQTYPATGEHNVVSRLGHGNSPAFTAEMDLFVYDSSHRYTPVDGSITITTSAPSGICGSFNIYWVDETPSGADSARVHTSGEFSAVPNSYTPAPMR